MKSPFSCLKVLPVAALGVAALSACSSGNDQFRNAVMSFPVTQEAAVAIVPAEGGQDYNAVVSGTGYKVPLGLRDPVPAGMYAFQTPQGQELTAILAGKDPKDTSCPVRYAVVDVMTIPNSGGMHNIMVAPVPGHCAIYDFALFENQAISIASHETGQVLSVYLMRHFEPVHSARKTAQPTKDATEVRNTVSAINANPLPSP